MKNLRILISRPDRIGDVVLSTPLPRAIKAKYPDSYVAILARRYTRDIYLNNPYVDEVITADEEGLTFLRLLKKIRKAQFSHAIMLLPSKKVNRLLFCSGIKVRIGVGHKFYQFITNTKSVYRRKYIPLRHEADYCADTLRKIGIEVNSLDSEIILSDEELGKSKSVKKDTAGNSFFIGINSTSGNSAPNMRIPEYRRLIEMLLPHSEFKIAVTDLVVPDELKNIPGVVYLNVNCSLRESIINFSALDLLISASTGPMHIAVGLKVPTLSLFCPLPACSPQLWRPMGNKQDIIVPFDNYCQFQCPRDPKLCHFEGPDGIDAEVVYLRTISFFRNEYNLNFS